MKERKRKLLLRVVPLTIVYGFMFIAALPVMMSWSAGLAVGLNAFLAVVYAFGLKAVLGSA